VDGKVAVASCQQRHLIVTSCSFGGGSAWLVAATAATGRTRPAPLLCGACWVAARRLTAQYRSGPAALSRSHQSRTRSVAVLGATAPVPAGRVHVYTDGSYDAASLPHSRSTSAWALTVADRWFDSNFSRIPADEACSEPRMSGVPHCSDRASIAHAECTRQSSKPSLERLPCFQLPVSSRSIRTAKELWLELEPRRHNSTSGIGCA